MEKHTPGKWKVCEMGRMSTVVDSEGFEIAWAVDECEKFNREAVKLRDENETEANARLIAAAPELLAALEKAREDINWMLNSREFLNGFVFDYIDTAIAKATGG